MITYTYQIRDKEITVSEVEDVLGVRVVESRGDEDPETVADELGLGDVVDELTGVRSDAARAFSEANWVFVHPSDAVRSAFQRGDTVSGTTHIDRVYHDEEGNPLVGTSQLTVRFRDETSTDAVDEVLEEFDLSIVQRFGFAPNLYKMRVESNRNPLELLSELNDTAAVEYAEPNLIEYLPERGARNEAASRFEPSDPEYTRQWQWRNIEIEQAWPTTLGEDVRIAVIDNGFQIDHPDLRPGVVKAAGTYQTTGGADEVFVPGPEDHPTSRHGTFCAGMAVARVNNGRGGCGAAPVSEFMPISCLPDQIGTQTTLARAVAYAADPSTESKAVEADLSADDGADVVSCSLGPSGGANWTMNSVLKDAVEFAVDNGRSGKGVALFWAVSNGNVTIDGEDGTDQVVSHPKTIAVGRSTRFNTEHQSAFGTDLDFLAPGVQVYSTTVGGRYTEETGTSFATPCAAGVAALVLSVDPEFSWDEVRSILRETCDRVGDVEYGPDGHHDRYGYGRINAKRAVETAVERSPGTGDTDDESEYPAISGPENVTRTGDPPSFDISFGFNEFGLVEVATDFQLFDYDAHNQDHDPTTIYPMWGEDDPSLTADTEWQLPEDVWDRLSFEGDEDPRLWYRLHTSSIDDGWKDYYVTTQNANADEAPSVSVTTSLGRPPGRNDDRHPPE
jgi:thermitase